MMQVVDCIGFSAVNDKTYITICMATGTPIAGGNWFQDQILEYSEEEVIKMIFDPLKNKLRLITRIVDWEA